MRRNIQYISSIFLAAVLLFSGACTREDLTPTPPRDRVALSEFGINYQIDGAEVYTKIALNERTENAVRNLYVLLFAEDGSLIHSKRYLVTNATSLPEDQATRYDAVLNSYYERDEGDSRLSSGIIPGFFSGYNFTDASRLEGNLTFYAIANYSQSVGDNLKAIKNKTELEDFTVDITHGSVERNYLFMVAAEEGVNLSPSTDNYGNITVERLGTNLRLRRLDARITFNIDIDIDGATEINFTNAIYRVHQIPNTSYLIEKSKTNNNTGTENTWDAADKNNNYSCMDDDNFAYFDRFEGTSGDFTFYMRENRPVPKVRITQEARTNENNTGKKEYDNLYVMREAWWNDASGITDETPVHEREFTYAPENSTFVEISGNLEYKRYNQETQSDEYVSGYVTYIVHLGETGGRYDYNNEDAVNNYDIRRNVRYTYNMRITGIHSFEIEVKADGVEKRPGAEGNFSISNSQQFTMDAHYGRLLLELDLDSILGLDEDGDGQQDGAGWNVSSPPLATTIFDGESISAPYNYKWILFAINKEFGGNESEMVKFPGIQAYDGGLKFHDGHTPDKDEILSDFGNRIDYNNTKVIFKEYLKHDTDNYYANRKIDDDACLRDINQLLRHLYQEAVAEKDGEENLFTTRSDGKRKVTITAFCDEFTYVYELENEDYRHPGTSLDPVNDKEVLQYWKRYVNQDDRVMNITPMTATDVSADKNTSITHSFVSISQKSIKTIYNENDPDLETAWGLETTNETGPLTYQVRMNDGSGKDPLNRGILNIGDNTTSDGRTNFLNFWLTGNPKENIRWTDVMTVSQRIENADGLTDDYRNAFHACMTRNRDLNGNNRIDEDEIYWYLASQDQLSGMYIGQPALEEDSWMYTGDGSKTNHLITSSLYNKGGYRFYRPADRDYPAESDIPNFWILWSEEGASWGQLRGGGDQGTGVTTYDYRCIRNLGIPTSERTAPTHYASIEDKGDYYTIDVSVVNQRALRSSDDQGDNLPFDNERSLSNRPFKSFDVLDGFYPLNGTITWNEMKEEGIMGNENPCPHGWRVPNQKEILIMMSLIGEDNFDLSTYGYNQHYSLGIATSFSFYGTGLYVDDDKDNVKLRIGFYYGYPNLILLNGNEPNTTPMKIRCVRDHTGN